MENEQCFPGIPNANANVEYRTGPQRSPSRILKKDVDQTLETPAGNSFAFPAGEVCNIHGNREIHVCKTYGMP